ncbi:hypothetical protein LIA77_10883 [Sarocladium implicatum]|nr:hypothetical protein LIA77_10883 [Sarocladium implicatum]
MLRCLTSPSSEESYHRKEHILSGEHRDQDTARTETVRPVLQANRSCSGSWPDPWCDGAGDEILVTGPCRGQVWHIICEAFEADDVHAKISRPTYPGQTWT